MPTSRIDFKGVAYYRNKNGHWVADARPGETFEHWSLHRAIWEHHNGPIPDRHDVVFADGDTGNLDPGNLVAKPRSRRPKGQRSDATRPSQRFNGTWYYLCPDGYYQCSASRAKATGHYLMHRAVWAHHNGSIPDGIHIHHKDGDRSNNDINNLESMPLRDHLSGEHGYARGASAEPSEVKSKRRREEWERKQPRTRMCAECGAEFTSTGQRAKFCRLLCGKRYRSRTGKSG